MRPLAVAIMLGVSWDAARAQSPAPTSDAWDAAKAARWLRAHDSDRSGTLSATEVQDVPCTDWTATDAEVRTVWGSGLYTIYGLDPEKRWVGSVWALEDDAREAAAARARACGLGPELDAPGPVARLLALPDGGSERWDRAARMVMLEAFDLDRSGAIDVAEEVGGISCEVWTTLDRRVREGWASGLYLTYGLAPDLLWIGDALGLDAAVAVPLRAALRRCDVPGSDRTNVVPTNPAVMAAAIRQLPRAGSPAWTDVVRLSLVRMYDGDGSGDLGEAAELRAVTCELWRTLDVSLRRDGGGGLLQDYGFGPDARWRGFQLGVQGSARALAADRITSCLRAPEGSAAAPDEAEMPTLDPTPERARAWFLRYDSDGSGSVDTRKEVREVPCGAWRELERAAQARFGVGVIDLYGLRPGSLWTGETLGIAERVGGPARRRAWRCTAAVRLGASEPGPSTDQSR